MAGGLGIDGLVSGFDTSAIVDALTIYRRKPIEAAQARITAAEARKTALQEINSKVLAFQKAAQNLRFPNQFQRSVVTSSDEAVLKATAGSTSLTGSFSFAPLRQASAAQFVSTGVRDPDKTPISASGGNITVELGDARVQRETDLATINGGKGFDRGSIRITDNAGRSTILDLSNALTLDDVVAAINSANPVRVTAKVDDNPASAGFGSSLVIENISGNGDLVIENVGTDRTADSLGITANVTNGRVNGSDIIRLERSSLLSSLNDGRGINGGLAAGNLTISGSISVTVNLDNARTVGDVLDAINTAGAGTISASIDGRGISINDTGNPVNLSVAGTAGKTTVSDLGLGASVLLQSGTQWVGKDLLASAGSVQLSTVKGVTGGGLGGTVGSPAQFTITDSANNVTTIDLTGREDMALLIARINSGTANVSARVNAAGNGIEIVDNAGGTLTIADVNGNAAAQLGLAGSHAESAQGGNINVQHVYRQRTLQSFTGTTGGNIRVSLRNGSSADINLTGLRTVGELLDRLNNVSGLTAAINATGDGLTLTDGTTGQAQLIIEDTQGSVAKSMNLAGRFDTATVDRRLEFTVAVTAQDKLNDVMLRLTDLSSAISVNTFGDGTDSSPARMSITSKKSGRAGMLMLSSTVNELQFQQTGAARDAVMLMGGGGAEPQVLRSSSGRFDVLPGVSLEMLGTSAQPVTVTLSRDNSGLADSMQALTDAFNELAELIDSHTSFNVNTFENGVLHGDSAIRQLETSLRRMMLDPVPGLGNTLNNLGGVGVRIGSDGRVAFDRTSFLNALDTRHDDVVRLFTNSAALTPATSVKKFALGQGLNTGPGADLRVELRDGGVIEIDLDGATNVEQLLQRMNADSRLEVRVSGDGRKLEFVDKTTGSGSFRVLDNNGAGAPVSLGLSSASDSDGDGQITGNDIILGDQLGVGRRMDFDLGAYTSPLDGVFRRLSESADERIAQSNRDIERQEKAVALERDRITRQFISLERYLAQSQTLQTQLASQLKVIEPPGK